MAGRRSPQSPSTNRLTSQPETIPSCYRRSRHAKFQPLSGRHHPRDPPGGPPLDFQAHLAALEAQGLLVRVDRPINKDTELHPLVRWQFQGGLAEDQRRAFLFTNVVDSAGPPLRHSGRGRRARGLAAHLCGRHGAPGRGDRGGLDARDRQSDCAGARALAAVPGGRDQGRRSARPRARASRACRCRSRRRASMPRPISPRRSASRAIPRPASRTWAPIARRSKRPTGSACAWPRASAAPAAICIGRSTNKPKGADAVRDRHRLRAGRDVHRAA